MRLVIGIVFLLASLSGFAQNAGFVLRLTTTNADISSAEVFLDNTAVSFRPDPKGIVTVNNVVEGKHVVSVFLEGYQIKTLQVDATVPFSEYTVEMEQINLGLKVLDVVGNSRTASGMAYLKYIEADGLFAGKKNEVVVPSEMNANTSTNNSRQVFSKVPGANLQETDAGGLQMGIGVRGLDPKRTSNFNTRQDGYDISADALGYPESYYTPPMEAVEQIMLVRGAASLQFGTQFGGLLNFKMKKGNPNKPFELVTRQTAGSYGFLGSFTSVGGTAGEWNYYGYYQHKEGNGWRPNSGFNANGGYAQVGRKIGKKWSVEIAYTHYHYNAKQPGGLTDRQFETTPELSFRDRNWFRVNWNVASMQVTGKLTKNLSLNSEFFGLKSSREALGFLGNINRIDTGGRRDLITGNFFNVGNETRLVQRFNINNVPGAWLIGSRLYQGNTRNRQGKATGFDGPDYTYISPDNLEGSDFVFPSQNMALFSELLLPLSSCWFLAPGIRFETIHTQTEGYYNEENRHPLTNDLLHRETVNAETGRSRNILLLGLGASWRCRPDVEFYANGSQNYRAMNFSDLYVSNPNLEISPEMKDETGYTLDLGVKGKLLKEAIHFDAGVFMIRYQDRIGEMLAVLENEEGIKRVVNYRSNIADARFVGVEVFEELDFVKLFEPDKNWRLGWYNNLALVDARYVSAEVTAFHHKRVENVPVVNYKTGVDVRVKGFGAGLQFNYVSDQFTDATNAEFFPDATVGTIPAYHVVDFSLNYEWKRLRVEGSINNLFDRVYFTRRATGYPGPGIIPAERRMAFLTLQVKI